jgi:hypothetical protein
MGKKPGSEEEHLAGQACSALGCGDGVSTEGRPLCDLHWRKLPKALRGRIGEENGLRDAVVYLGKRDGYLAEVPERRATITEAGAGGGLDYV